MLEPVGQLRARADLHLVVDGVRASIVGDGARMTLSTSNAPALLGHALGALPATGGSVLVSARRVVARTASALNEAGLSMALVEPGGTVVHLGAGCNSRLTHLLLGTPHAEFGTVRSVGDALSRYARGSAVCRARAYQAAGGLALAGVLVSGVRRRRNA